MAWFMNPAASRKLRASAIVGDDAEADFVGDEDDGALKAGQGGDEFAHLSFPVALRMHEVGEPQRQAIDEPRAAAVCCEQRGQEIERHLAFDPVGLAARTMAGDARLHFAIEGLGRRDIDRLPGKGAREHFRALALARSRSARDQDDGHKGLLWA